MEEQYIEDVDGWGVFCRDIACAMTSMSCIWPFELDLWVQRLRISTEGKF